MKVSDTNTITGSEEQEAIWQAMQDQARGRLDHLVVNALAGAGKTTTALEGARRVKEIKPSHKIWYLCFNKSVQEEMRARQDLLNPALEPMTYHALGLRVLRHHFPNLPRVNFSGRQGEKDRMWDLIRDAKGRWGLGEEGIRSGIYRLAKIAKQYDARDEDSLRKIADHHGMDLGSGEEESAVVALTVRVLDRAADITGSETIGFDDMVWLPKRLGLSLGGAMCDLVISDESQDLNPVQQWAATTTGMRTVVIGDTHQACYGFRGADVNAMENITANLSNQSRIHDSDCSISVMPLTYTRRCPQLHVRIARKLVPDLNHMPDAPEGLERVETLGNGILGAAIGDMVLCRTNAPLISAAYGLIKAGVPACIRGTEIGHEIMKLAVKVLGESTIGKALARAQQITDEEVKRHMRKRQGEQRANQAQERMDCLIAASEGATSMNDVIGRLKVLFEPKDASQAVMLGTVHKSKGLEAGRVWVLRPDLMPHPMAKRDWEQVQERNLLYIALTRANWRQPGDGELVWVGGRPEMVK